LPVLDFDCEWKENERKMRQDMKNDAVEMLTAAGVKNVKGYEGDGTSAAAFTKWARRAWAATRKHRC
jgi:hypothetical protein